VIDLLTRYTRNVGVASQRKSNWISAVGALLIIYGFSSVIFSAWDLGVTADERIFTYFGLDYLRGDMSAQNMTPPFSRWFGALGASLVGEAWPQAGLTEIEKLQLVNETVFFYRISHAVLFLICCVWIFKVITLQKGVWAGLAFATFVSLDPSIKALSALNVTDANVSLLIAVSGIHLYLFLTAKTRDSLSLRKRKYIDLIIASFFSGIAVTAKVTGFLYLPFIALAVLVSTYRGHGVSSQSRRLKGALTLDWILGIVVLGGLAGFACIGGVTLGYLGDLSVGVANLLDIVFFQSDHNVSGHPSALFGQYRTHGFWYYFPVVFFFKTPLPLLVLLAVSLVSIFSYFKRHAEVCFEERQKTDLIGVAIAFFLPAFFIFVFLSFGNIHIGIRYLLPAIILLWIGLSVIVFAPTSLEGASKWRKGILVMVIIFGLAGDFRTLEKGAYLSFFNFLTPDPVLNFSDSNSSWRQGLPKHLSGDYQTYQEFSGFIGDYVSVTGEDSAILANAANLGGTRGINTHIMLRPFPPEAKISGHRLYILENTDWYRLLSNKLRPPSQMQRDPESVQLLSQPLQVSHIERVCPRKLVTNALDLGKLIEDYQNPVVNGWTLEDYVKENNDLWVEFESNLPGDIEQYGRSHWIKQGFREGREVTPYQLSSGQIYSLDGFEKYSSNHAVLKTLFGSGEAQFGHDKQKAIITDLFLHSSTENLQEKMRLEAFLENMPRVNSYTGIRENLSLATKAVDLPHLNYSGGVSEETKDKYGVLRAVAFFAKLELPTIKIGEHQLLIEIDYRRAKKLGLRYPKSMVIFVDGRPVMLGGHDVELISGPELGLMNWVQFNTVGKNLSIELFLEPHARIRNMLLLWQSCG
jgi:hypothetical protein